MVLYLVVRFSYTNMHALQIQGILYIFPFLFTIVSMLYMYSHVLKLNLFGRSFVRSFSWLCVTIHCFYSELFIAHIIHITHHLCVQRDKHTSYYTLNKANVDGDYYPYEICSTTNTGVFSTIRTNILQAMSSHETF